MVLILLAFSRDTWHRHPHLLTGFENYRQLLLAGEPAPEEIVQRLASLGAEAGLDETVWQALLAELLHELGVEA